MTHKFLIIQTAFTGDVVLATALVETLHLNYPGSQIDFLLRKGNEGLLQGHPHINNLLVWDKKTGKNKNLFKIARRVRNEKYTHVINPHRFGSSGFITWFSRAKYKAGFDKNPFAFCYTKKVKHAISEPYTEHPVHEVERNHQLVAEITVSEPSGPKLYPTQADYEAIDRFLVKPYVCIAPASVWFTKQFPADKWAAMISELPEQYRIYIIGAPSDSPLAETIMSSTTHPHIANLCGKLNFLQSAALMQSADMNYTNDSAPLHFASSLNAPVTAVFCSTVPAFGFGPLRNNGKVVEIQERLYCRPCGLHGHKQCPESHFRCAKEITNLQLLWWISKAT
ncbi:MAG: glycosyltransferase family 9 protein [Flavipsychrobacter sp.]|nr:glycosyltransferase family 9 protein [Flavipsychrobacter sp.]